MFHRRRAPAYAVSREASGKARAVAGQNTGKEAVLPRISRHRVPLSSSVTPRVVATSPAAGCGSGDGPAEDSAEGGGRGRRPLRP